MKSAAGSEKGSQKSHGHPSHPSLWSTQTKKSYPSDRRPVMGASQDTKKGRNKSFWALLKKPKVGFHSREPQIHLTTRERPFKKSTRIGIYFGLVKRARQRQQIPNFSTNIVTTFIKRINPLQKCYNSPISPMPSFLQLSSRPRFEFCSVLVVLIKPLP